MGLGGVSPSVIYDTGIGLFLRRSGPQEKHSFDDHVQLRNHRAGGYSVSPLGLQSGLPRSPAGGPDIGGFIGNLEWFGLKDVAADAPGPYSDTIPHQAYMIFQAMFAIITPALVTGAFAERMKFGALCVFIVLWVTIVYAPLAHWVWGGGWLGVWEPWTSPAAP